MYVQQFQIRISFVPAVPSQHAGSNCTSGPCFSGTVWTNTHGGSRNTEMIGTDPALPERGVIRFCMTKSTGNEPRAPPAGARFRQHQHCHHHDPPNVQLLSTARRTDQGKAMEPDDSKDPKREGTPACAAFGSPRQPQKFKTPEFRSDLVHPSHFPFSPPPPCLSQFL